MAIDVREAVILGTVSGLLAAAGAAQAQEQAVQQLSPVVVRGVALDPVDTGDRVWLPVNTSTTKTGTPVLETAQSVSTVTRKQLDEQAPQTVSEALRYTAGVLSDRDSNTRYDSVFLRGFGAFGTATNYVSFLDGLKLPRGQAFAQTSIDPYLLDRIDVLKGPSALLYGQISPGGLVNQVSRRPSDQASHEILLEGGSEGRAQAGFSSAGALNADGTLQYSVAAIGRRADSRYSGVKEGRVGVAPSITWQPNGDTTFTLSAYYQKDPDGGYFNSLYPKFLAPSQYKDDLGRKLNIGDPDFDAFKREQHGIGYQLEHRASSTLTLRSRLRYSDVDVDFRSLQMAAPMTADGIIARQALRSIEHVQGVSMDNQAQFDFATGAVQHTLLTGLDYQYTRSDWRYNWGPAPSLNVANPQYGVPIGALTTIIDSGQTLRQTGAYVQDQLRFGGFRATLGVRHDWTEQDTDNRLGQDVHRPIQRGHQLPRGPVVPVRQWPGAVRQLCHLVRAQRGRGCQRRAVRAEQGAAIRGRAEIPAHRGGRAVHRVGVRHPPDRCAGARPLRLQHAGRPHPLEGPGIRGARPGHEQPGTDRGADAAGHQGDAGRSGREQRQAAAGGAGLLRFCLLYTSPSPRD